MADTDTWEYEDWTEVPAPRNITREWTATFGEVFCVVDEHMSISGDEVWFSFAARRGTSQRDGSYLDSLDAAYSAAHDAAREMLTRR